MKIGFWELVVIVVIAFVFIGPDQLPVYAKKLGKMLRELKKYTGAASEEIQKNVVEPLNEIQAPLKEAVAPLTDIKKDIDNSVKDVTKSFTGIGKTSKEEAAKAEQAEEVTELEEVEELPEETPAEAPAAEAPKAEETPAAEPVKAEEKTDAPRRGSTRGRRSRPRCRSRTCRRGKGLIPHRCTRARGCLIHCNQPASRRGKVKRRSLLCVLVLTSCLSSWSSSCSSLDPRTCRSWARCSARP